MSQCILIGVNVPGKKSEAANSKRVKNSSDKNNICIAFSECGKHFICLITTLFLQQPWNLSSCLLSLKTRGQKRPAECRAEVSHTHGSGCADTARTSVADKEQGEKNGQ